MKTAPFLQILASLGFLASVSALAMSCSSDATKPSTLPHETPDGGSPSDTDAGLRPAGPAAHVAGLLSGGKGVNLGASKAVDMPAGWVEEEYALEGTAISYVADAALPADGTFAFHEGASADYGTRVVVRRPGKNADFNGTVVVEWLNVSGGVDANPDFAYMASELLRGGYAWVGVSAQMLGIEGGPVLVSTPVSDQAGAGLGLRVLDPERYDSLHHPGDAFAYDIYTQVARALRVKNGGLIGALTPRRILAVGESQSAFMLTTYVDGIHPLVRQYDGFFLHSRGAGAPSVGEAGKGIDLASSLGGTPTHIRTDLREPVLMMQTETDLLEIINFYPARQPDTDLITTWEVAGTAHADAYIVGDAGSLFQCATPLNAGPQHFVAKSALRHLNAWVKDGTAPPAGARLEVDTSGASRTFAKDENGNALGGVRTPEVDVPVDTLSGASGGGSIACLLFGSTVPLSAERIAALYPSPDAYIKAYETAADKAIKAGFVLEDDRDALLADADPSRVTAR